MSAQTVKIVRWGNSLAVRLPKAIVKRAGLAEGEAITVDVAEEGHVRIKKARPKLTIEALVAGITPENRHGEITTGFAVGREVLDEW